MLNVKNNTLIIIVGLIWLLASFILLFRAYSWIDLLTQNQLIIGTVLALPLAIVKSYFIFHKLTMKNIYRIMNYGDTKISVLNFHILKDKILIVVMIVGGSLLRHSSFTPKSVLMPIYFGIGLAMLYVSYVYFNFLIKESKKQ